MFLGVDFIDGVGKPALQGTNFSKEWGVEGELVARIGGCADRAERGDKNVEC